MTSRFNTVIVICAMLIGAVACSGQTGGPAGDPTSTAATTDETAAVAGGVRTVTGTVVETMDAASYTYVLVDTGDEQIWAATSKFDVAVGDRVTVPLESPMANFHSDTLDRDFELIYFVSHISGDEEAAVAAMLAEHPPTSVGAPEVAPEVSEGEIEPAAGGQTVAAVWAEAADRAGTVVTVRGRVVKFNAGILGTNWIHLQDGTGDAADGTHDITVTSQAVVAVGDVVTATGTVAVNQDFGAGYVYPVMVKDATIE